MSDERRITFGTSLHCTVTVPNAPYLSSRHFELILNADGLWVDDLGSSNGTKVDTGFGWQQVWARIKIGPGDRILAGRLLFNVTPDGKLTMSRPVGAHP